MAARKRAKGKKPSVKAVKKAVKNVRAKPSKALKRVKAKGLKCCSHCPDFSHCDEKSYCCDYCDYYLNAKCTFGKKKGIPSVNQEIELPDYRGDDFGIDDYEAYEPVYE